MRDIKGVASVTAEGEGALFLQVNRNKRSVVLDLKLAADLDAVDIVRHRLRAIDQGHGPFFVREPDELLDRVDGAERVRDVGDGDDPRAGREQPLEGGHVAALRRQIGPSGDSPPVSPF